MFKRTLTLRQRDNQQHDSVYALVLPALQATIETLLPEITGDCANWPTIDWCGQGGNLCANEWVSEENPNNRLLSLQLQVTDTNRIWHFSLSLGCTSAGEAVWHEECRIEPVPPQFPLQDMPSLCGCLSAFTCYDLDGMRTGVPYTVEKAKLGKLKSFLIASGKERKLPIVLISPQAGMFPYALEYRMLARLLCGVAHVMRLDASTGWAINAISSAHGCYNGAVRIYWPGYTQKDNANVHQYWRSIEHKIRCEDQIELLDQLATRVAATLPEHPLIAQLRRRQQDEQRDRESRITFEQIKQQVQIQEKEKWEEHWEESFERLHADTNKILSDRDYWRAEAERWHDKARELEYRLRQQWNEVEARSGSEDETASYITMSDRAEETYLNLDGSQQEQMDSLLEKLSDTKMREGQSEVDHFTEGTACYIYPRSRTASGKRVLYLLNGTEVRICEIYACHDTYEKARSSGWQASDYLSAKPWSLPAKDGPQIPLPM